MIPGGRFGGNDHEGAAQALPVAAESPPAARQPTGQTCAGRFRTYNADSTAEPAVVRPFSLGTLINPGIIIVAVSYVISIMARDRVGIVADVSSSIRTAGGVICEMSQTVLCGYFTMILVTLLPEEVAPSEIRKRLQGIDPDDPFEIGVKRMAPDAPLTDGLPRGADDSQRYVLTATGPHSPDFVPEVTGYLRQKNINIEDIATRLDGDRYTMILLLHIPGDVNLTHLKRGLRIAVEDFGIRVEIQHHDIFRATNEI